MKAIKWDPFEREYSDYKLPEGASTYSFDMDAEVSCASCGNVIRYAESFSSLEIHTATGIGYAVCGECYGDEIARRAAADGFKSREELEAMTMRELKELSVSIGCGRGYSAALKSVAVDEIMAHQRFEADKRMRTARTLPERHR